MSKITTTGQLREFLASTLNGVANGTFDLEKAKNVVKLSQQINESFYAEIKVARVQHDLGNDNAKLGDLQLKGEN